MGKLEPITAASRLEWATGHRNSINSSESYYLFTGNIFAVFATVTDKTLNTFPLDGSRFL